MRSAASDARAGAAVYFRFTLVVYDYLVLGFYSTFCWGCSVGRILQPLYANTIRDATHRRDSESTDSSRWKDLRILDVGVGTGYYLANAPVPPSASVYLADLNHNTLEYTTNRITRTHPEVRISSMIMNVLDEHDASWKKLVDEKSAKETTESTGFDVISVMFLLHCLPGPPERKVQALLRLGTLLRDDGVLVGSTILGSGVTHNWLGRLLMWAHNHSGIFGNWEDSANRFLKPMEENGFSVESEVHGRVLCFKASLNHD